MSGGDPVRFGTEVGEDMGPVGLLPVKLPGPFSNVALGMDHVCVLLVNSSVFCW